MSKVKCKYKKLDHIQLVGAAMAEPSPEYEQQGTTFASLDDHSPELDKKAGFEDSGNTDSFINVPVSCNSGPATVQASHTTLGGADWVPGCNVVVGSTTEDCSGSS